MSKQARAARAKAANMEANKNNKNKTMIVGGILVAAAAIGIIAIAAIAANSDTTKAGATNDQGITGPVSTPAGVRSGEETYPYAVVAGNYTDGKPTVEIWKDFQCPGCAALELSETMQIINQAAEQGNINLLQRPVAFLDAKLANNSSSEAMNAYGCALDAGIGSAYSELVFTNQPQQEGQGYDKTLLKELAAQSGLDTQKKQSFELCVDEGPYSNWAKAATAEMLNSSVPGTPYVVLDGQVIAQETLTNTQALKELLNP